VTYLSAVYCTFINRISFRNNDVLGFEKKKRKKQTWRHFLRAQDKLWVNVWRWCDHPAYCMILIILVVVCLRTIGPLNNILCLRDNCASVTIAW
jgi:hypothetical protein